VSEIAEIGEEEVSIAENSPSLPRIEYSASKGIGSLAGEELTILSFPNRTAISPIEHRAVGGLSSL